MIRHGIRQRLLARTLTSASPLDRDCLMRPTLVLAPHPDDETLGCGGLILLLRERGTPVRIVFMTDGAGSHAGVGAVELAEIRHGEAIAAAAILGVPESDLYFLDHPDGQLASAEEVSVRQLATLLESLNPDQVVLPHPSEPNADHAATFRIADRAARERGTAIDGLLYMVWFWDQWPWTNPFAPPRSRHGRRQIFEVALRGRLGFGVGRGLTHVIDISTVTDRKRAALAAHASQMSRRADRPGWLVLADVANGDWLELLLQDHELYSTARLGAGVS